MYFKLLLAVVPLCFGCLNPLGAMASELEPDKIQEYSIAPISSIKDFLEAKDRTRPDHFNSKHWAYNSLDELVDIYQCVAGFPDGTFKGDQPATRFEMAALVDSCLGSGLSLHVDNSPRPPASHEHPINPYLLITIITGIIAFIIYQYRIFTKIKKLESNVEEILRERKSTVKDRITPTSAMFSMVAAVVTIAGTIVSLWSTQNQEASQRPVQQTLMLHQSPGTLSTAHSKDEFLEHKLAATLLL